MATCPSGHESASDDFCDVCGVLIGAAPSLAAPGSIHSAGTVGSGGTAGQAGGPGASGGVQAEPCPVCGTPRAGRFCEGCGHDFAAAPPGAPSGAPTVWPPAPAPGSAWAAVVTADRAYYDTVQAAGGPEAAAVAFPAYCPRRRFALDGPEVRIGRRSASSGISPEIDLSVPPADPGVSRLHAVLLRAPDGSWTVVDPGSANGTAVNGSEIPAGQPVPLRDGDHIHLGAWTRLELIREP